MISSTNAQEILLTADEKAAICSQREKKMKLIVNRVQNLPTPPIVFSQICNLINDPEASAYDVAGLISEDPALTAKILKLTNSSFYGIPRTITNVKQATVILGLEVVRSLVISASVFDMFSRKYKFDVAYLDNFWRHSLMVAFMARIISRMERFSAFLEAELSFAGGLLHDIGKLILISHMPDEHAAIKTLTTQNSGLPEYDAEMQVLEFSHTDIGAFLCAKWNLPETLCQAIRDHHDKGSVSTNAQSGLIHLADYLAHKMDLVDGASRPNLSALCPEVWGMLGLSPDQECQLIDALKADYSRSETFVTMARGQN
jgi:putative nucleotidyltransferase with HDIG domain